MSNQNEQTEEERALDALIVGALRHEEACRETPALEEALTEEDHRALDALGPNVARHILAGKWKKPGGPLPAKRPAQPLATAMNRSGDTDDVSERAREEMEQKVREAEEKEPSKEDEEREGR